MSTGNATIDQLKTDARKAHPSSKHGNILGAIAAGFGFKSWASLRSSPQYSTLRLADFKIEQFDAAIARIEAAWPARQGETA